MTGCGLGFAFGVYQELYESIGGPFQGVNPAANLIGTLSASLMTLGAPLATIGLKKYDPRLVVLLGAALFAISGMIWAPFLRYLISAVGILALPNQPGSQKKDRNDQPTRGRGKTTTEKAPIQSPKFITHASGTALQAAAYMIPMYFMSSYARTLGYTTAAGANTIALSNACNSGGKIIIGYYADRLGCFNTLVLDSWQFSDQIFHLLYFSRANWY
ncbi:uncharacterized protein N7482_009032 [Penicillium canariense]|uniref:Major facilitator superfamily (MFS) profile domain-containing protein n=1 Tax=Penicillium canariense TaxID=189055 RepID=A0A9W9HPJ9_9EURO|nr:uncharacterized protein N7482_009032 [Penicillium canariense]KAJ5152554.1 hypothetical protein N7482_009032 [Penicillium canariense]